FTVNQTTSTLSYQFNASAPFSGTMVGANDPTQPAAMQTRTKLMTHGIICLLDSCGTFTATTNQTVPISATIAASGQSTSSTMPHPGGTFKLAIDTSGATPHAILQDFNVNMLAAGSISASANMNQFTYQSFCTLNPSCNAPFCAAVSLPLGTVDVTALQ